VVGRNDRWAIGEGYNKHETEKGAMNRMEINVSREKNTLRIEVPIERPWLSKSGKTVLIASTHGSKMTSAKYKNRNILLLLNAFIYPTDQELAKYQKKQPGSGKPDRN
jgi:hypothetical protein